MIHREKLSLDRRLGVSVSTKADRKASKPDMSARISLPNKRPLVQALSSAILLMAVAVPAARAQVYTGEYHWSTGNLTVGTGGAYTAILNPGANSGAVQVQGTVGTLTNSGTIFGGHTGFNNAGTMGVLLNSGTISGGNSGIINQATIGVLTNSGTISGGMLGIENYDVIDTLLNIGSITVVVNDGIINKLFNSGSIFHISNFDTIGTLVDAGSITTAGANVTVASGSVVGASLFFTNLGTISTLIEAGVYNAVSIVGITNSGTINSGSNLSILNMGYMLSSPISAGIYNDVGGTIGAITNNGLITSTSGYGIENNGVVTLIQNNSGGTISGAATAIYNAAGGTIGSIANSGLISGNIVNLSANALTISGGSGATVGTLTGVGGAVGTITNTQSGLVFASGNELLNDQLVLGSGYGLVKNGTGTLTVTAGQTYAGATTIASGGTLALSGAGNLAASSGVADNGTFDISSTTGASIKTLSGSGAVTLGAQTVTLTNAIDTFSGTISGAGGGLTLASGSQTLTGNNTYTGATTIASGTLQIGNGGTSGSIAGNIVDNGALVFNRSDNVAYAGAITGTGNLTQAGTGTLTLAGGNAWSGNTTISAGTLGLGSYTQTSGQTLNIGAASASNYGKLSVTGTATFNTGANLAVNVASINTLAKGQTLVDVISAGTLNASTFNVTDNSALFDFMAVINGNTVNLNVVGADSVSRAVQAYGLMPAQGAAQVLDTQVNGSPSGDMVNVVTALGQLPDQGSVARAAAQTLPANSGNQAIMGALSSINHIVSDRLAPGGTGLSTGDAVANKHVWVKPFGSHASQNDENGASGFSSNTWGLAVGAEGDWDTTRLGLAYAYANTHVNGNTALSGTGANTQVNSNVLTFYGSRPVHGLMLDFQADTGWNDNSSQRGLNFGNLNRTASGSYGTWSTHVGTGLSKTLPLSPDMAFIPGIRVDYTRLQSQSYGESGAGALNLNVNANTVQSLVLGADARLVSKIGERGKLSAHVGVGYDTINDPGNIVAAYAGAPGQSFTTPGLRHSPWLMTAGLGYDYRTEHGTNIALRYDIQGRSGFINQSASLNVSWVF